MSDCTSCTKRTKVENCSFCNPKRKDWEENGFYGYRCPACQGDTAFVMTTEHRDITEQEKKIIEELCQKYYPNYKLKWISKNRKNIIHWFDFLVPK